MEVRDKINDFICKTFCGNDRSRMPRPDDPLLGSDGGAVDSVGIHEIISFIEADFAITIDDLDIVPENFESLSKLTAYVMNKCQYKK